MRTASEALASPNLAGLVTMATLAEQQQPAADIAERITEGGDDVVLGRLRDVDEQRVVEDDAAPEADAGERVDDGRTDPVALLDRVQPPRSPPRRSA
jgi:hypothetical protein